MLDELLAQPGVVEHVQLRSRFGFMALHGGSLERMTDVIAVEAAERAHASLYAVTQPENLRWHVPSRLFDPVRSPGLAAFLGHVDQVIAVHGFGRADLFTTLLLGGRDRTLADELAGPLSAALPSYSVISDLAAVPPDLGGQHPDNPVNRARGGVQLELPPRVRGLGPYWEGRPDRGADRRALTDALAGFAADRAQES